MAVAWSWQNVFIVMFIKRSIRFILHLRKHKEGEEEKAVAIRLRVAFGGKSLDFATGLHVLPSCWDNAKQTVKSGKDKAETNRILAEMKNTMEEVFARYELIEKRIPAVGEVKDLFNDMNGKPSIKVATPDENLFLAFDIFMESQGKKNQWTDSTYKKFATIKEHLKAFDKDLCFHAVNEDKLEAFVQFLTKKKGMRNTTIAKDLVFVRWFFRWAATQGYYEGNVHETFKPKFKGTNGEAKEIIYLSQDEVKAFQDFQPKPGQEHLGRVRDVFLFCCFTGLRYSDVAKLRKDDIKDGYFDIVTQKTVDGIRIELNKHSQAIIDKYKDCQFPKGKLFPIVSNQKMNEYLKEIGKLCGLDEPTRIVYFMGNERHEEVYPKHALLTTHCGRRTFVVNALRLGIPAEVIIRWTGHSDYKSLKPYVKIVDELKKREMSKFDDF